MEFEDILKLIDKVSESSLAVFTYESEGTKISLKKDRSNKVNMVQMPITQPVAQQEPQISNQVAVNNVTVTPSETYDDSKTIKSPLVGTFYAASSPESEPFVTIGSQVKTGDTLGIIEAMKLMNEIECEYDGVIKKVLVENGDLVEYGQPLFAIE